MAESDKQKQTKRKRGCKPGTTNNPKGRPPIERTGGIALSRLAEEMVIVTENGETLVAKEAIYRKIIEKAVDGDTNAIKIYLDRTEGSVKQDIELNNTGTMQVIFNDNLEGV